MTNQSFFYDVVSTLPDGATIEIVTTDEDFESKLQGISFNNSNDRFYKFQINFSVRQILLEKILQFDLQDYIESVVVSLDTSEIFIGYDGVGYGQMSKSILEKHPFLIKYKQNEMLDMLD